MNALMTLALSNIAMATLLAILAWAAGRWLRRPAITHGLWLLVFVKLLTPPLVSVPVIRIAAPPAPVVAANVPAPQEAMPVQRPAVELVAVEIAAVDDALPPANDAAPQIADVRTLPQNPAPEQPKDRAELPNEPIAAAPVVVAPAPPIEPAAASESSTDWSWLPTAVGWTWLGGAVLWLTVALVRIIRFHRLLGCGNSAPAELRRLAEHVAVRMGVSCPRLILVPGTLSPMLWVFGREPRLVLPAALVDRLTPEQWRTLLAHELAHWLRRDHWVRWLELATLAAYWWCPLVWWAKQQLQEAEEECCDAWVVSTLPGAARAYALALVETVDFLSGARAVLPPAASGLGHVHLLQRRLTMILRGRTPRGLTLTGLLVVLTLGVGLLPLAPSLAQEPPPAAAAVQQEEKAQDKAAQEKLKKEEKADDKDQDPDKARQDLQKLQDDFIKLQRQMEDRRREFEEKLHKEFGEKQQQLSKQMQEAMRKAGFPTIGLNPGFAPGGLQPPAGFPGLPQPGALPPGGLQPGQFPGGNPFGGPPRPDFERRLDNLERKLDALLEKLGGKAPDRRPSEKKDESKKDESSRDGAGNVPAPAGVAPVRDPARQPAVNDSAVLPRQP